jgi:hypothetical protein
MTNWPKKVTNWPKKVANWKRKLEDWKKFRYFDFDAKLKFMDNHGIDTSVISLANPWLTFLRADEEPQILATKLNDDLNEQCEKKGLRSGDGSNLKLRSSSARRRPKGLRSGEGSRLEVKM